jgi:hypothetical protein
MSPTSFKQGDHIECVSPTQSSKQLKIGDRFIVQEYKKIGGAYYIGLITQDRTDIGFWLAYRFEKIKQFTINNHTKTI